jgi:hypothetical protein
VNGASSALKVLYDLRPAKQIERRMLIDAFQILATHGFPIRDYQYTGMGAIYFVDFVLFHKLLGIADLVSVEADRAIERRINFNKPFGDVRVFMEPIGDRISKLDRDKQHLLWMDYDYRLNNSVAADTNLAASVLSAGSILLVTVDLEPPPDQREPDQILSYYEAEAQRYFARGWTRSNFTLDNLPHTVATIVFNAIGNGVTGRSVQFIPLFNFVYSDGHRMLTVGGVVGSDSHARQIATCDFSRQPFIRRSLDTGEFVIAVPRLTRKERLLLDREMPCADTWNPSEFELAQDEILRYRDIYRYYPAFAELLI